MNKLIRVLLFFAWASCSFLSCTISDLRTPFLLADDDRSTGKRDTLLYLLESRYGGYDRWMATPAISVTGVDEWPTFHWRLIAGPWKNIRTGFVFTWLPNTDNSRIRLLDGKEAGIEYGIQQWATYSVQDSVLQFKDHRDIWFHLPTMEYFLEFPFRIREAGIIRYAGTRMYAGTAYERLFFTWESVAPNPVMDQYLVYINPQTHLIDYLELTVRDQAKWAYATVRFEDYTEQDGFTFPTRMEFFFQNKLPGKTIGHRIELSGVEIHDQFEQSEIIRDASIKKTKF